MLEDIKGKGGEGWRVYEWVWVYDTGLAGWAELLGDLRILALRRQRLAAFMDNFTFWQMRISAEA